MNQDAPNVLKALLVNAQHMEVVSDVMNQVARKVPKARQINA
jgi:hypothetical protein